MLLFRTSQPAISPGRLCSAASRESGSCGANCSLRPPSVGCSSRSSSPTVRAVWCIERAHRFDALPPRSPHHRAKLAGAKCEAQEIREMIAQGNARIRKAVCLCKDTAAGLTKGVYSDDGVSCLFVCQLSVCSPPVVWQLHRLPEIAHSRDRLTSSSHGGQSSTHGSGAHPFHHRPCRSRGRARWRAGAAWAASGNGDTNSTQTR